MSFLRGKTSVFVALGAGIFLGAGAVSLYCQRRNRLAESLQRLLLCIEELKRDVDELKRALHATSSKPSPRRRRKVQEFHSIIDSSGDDDLFEEANTGGRSDEEVEENATESDNYFSSDGFTSPSSYKSAQSHQSSASFHSAKSDITNKQPDSTKTPDDLYAKIDGLIDGSDQNQEEAYEILSKNKLKYSREAEYMWRLAKATYLVANIYGAKGNDEKKKVMMYGSSDAADSAVKLDENSANAHKWYSITVGGVSNYESTKEKIKLGYDIKNHTERAIELNPSDPSNHYMLGRWCYSVYMLTWIERNVAATLFATPPTATIDEALNHFLETERLKPGVWKENMLYIAKSYIEKRNYTEASRWLKKAEQLPIKNQDDKAAHDEVTKLLLKYR